MAKRKKIPVVGTRGVRTAQLSPELRSIEKRRAEGAAAREYAPVIAAKRAPIEGARRSFRNEAASIHGATRMGEASLDRALRSLSSSGLEGRYKAQATREFASRRADVASGLPYLLADAREARDDTIADARTDLLAAQAEQQKSAAEKFDTRLKELRGDAASTLKEREDKEKGGDFDFTELKLKNAGVGLSRLLARWLENPEIDVTTSDGKQKVPMQEANPLKTMDQWRDFADGVVSTTEGTDIAHVMEVIRRRLKHRKKELRQVDQGKRAFKKVSPITRTHPLYQPFNAGG